MAKRLIEKKITYYQTLLVETDNFFKRLLIKFWIYEQKCNLRKYKKK